MPGAGGLPDQSSLKDTDGMFSFKPDDFKDSAVIGKGKDCIVYSSHCSKLDGRKVAVKVYEKSSLSASKLRAVKREAAMMIYMTRKRVPLITQFYGAFQDAYQIFLVMEYCAGGDLLDRLLEEGRAMSERRVILEVAVPLLKTLQHLHSYSIIHRDVKLENIFIAEDGRVRLGDFGLTMSMKQELAISPVGTVEYMAPEVVALPPVEAVVSGAIKTSDIPACNEKVDIWALGVTLYELLTGHLPFEGRSKEEIKHAISAGIMRPFPAAMSPACVSFVSAMMLRDTAQRPGAKQLLQHPIVLTYLRTLVPTQPIAMMPPLASTSDSASSLNGTAAMPRPLFASKRPGQGSVGTITVSVNGRQQPLSASFSVTAAQPATTAPELVSTVPPGHRLESSGGSLIKAKFQAMECLSGGQEEAGSSASSCDVFSNPMSACATHTGSSSPVGSGDSSRDSAHDNSAAAPRRCGSSGAASVRPSSPIMPRAMSSGMIHQRPASAGARPLRHAAAQDDHWMPKHKRKSTSALPQAAKKEPLHAPGAVVMSKADGQHRHLAGSLREQYCSAGRKGDIPLSRQPPPPKPPLAPSSDDDPSMSGLMGRVTSLFSRALYKHPYSNRIAG
ncbi:hypothetical protein CVIRNUC_002117 [Coccomyxa viridis]|uniref:Protein kinase domain-containing protein n=1 Tax=Coccomyxa viridis TaxID=1274662 RepID=A0AAV1HXK2_9CHLO|nr:hypothetical protein CVIRNUC_002117 [Coccomyxa viridis]